MFSGSEPVGTVEAAIMLLFESLKIDGHTELPVRHDNDLNDAHDAIAGPQNTA